MEFLIDHETVYRYGDSVSESYTVVHLQPRNDPRQYCTRYDLGISPLGPVYSYRDRYGNDVQHFAVVPEHEELRIVARSRVVTVPGNGMTVPHGVTLGRIEADPYVPDLYDFRHASPYVALGDVRPLLERIVAPPGDLAAYFMAAGRYVHDTFAYVPGSTTVATTVAEAVAASEGVCQDFAHVLIALARARGIPTRYASGYIFRGSEATVGAEPSHAWAEAYLPPYGWVGFDPTNDRLVDDAFVLVAVGRDYGDVSPTRGFYRGRSLATLDVNVSVDAASFDQ